MGAEKTVGALMKTRPNDRRILVLDDDCDDGLEVVVLSLSSRYINIIGYHRLRRKRINIVPLLERRGAVPDSSPIPTSVLSVLSLH